MRWASELVYLEEKQTLAGGQPVTAATPAGAYRMAAATVAAHQALRIARRRHRRGDRRRARPDQRHRAALRAVTASIGAGQGATASALSAAIEITRRDITAHPLRLVTAWRPGRHYPRSPSRKSGPARATTSCPPPPGCICCPCPRRQDRSSRTPRRPPDPRALLPSPAPAAPGHRHAWHRRSPAGQGLPGHRSPSSRASHTRSHATLQISRRTSPPRAARVTTQRHRTPAHARMNPRQTHFLTERQWCLP